MGEGSASARRQEGGSAGSLPHPAPYHCHQGHRMDRPVATHSRGGEVEQPSVASHAAVLNIKQPPRLLTTARRWHPPPGAHSLSGEKT